ncbi:MULTISPECIES: hypothetical protein [unclassified Streptomyces]|uniref:hypothetical protein n=1 Tax=unclassified Streptomyces TaxID=2593676 RepID=UPI002349D371|nr:hypothetical protein [Streptomyces sp. M92]WCN04470.1 hypothetical protein M6G08_21450 [Streptomyces sp. M92]
MDAGSVVTDVLKTVRLPAGRYVERALPRLSAVTISVIVAVVVAGGAGAIKPAAAVVFLALALHNGHGLAPGYGAGRLGRLGEPAGRRRPAPTKCPRTPPDTPHPVAPEASSVPDSVSA